MKGTILQPTYLPWLGYFEMIGHSDVFVVFDHVQFERKSWQQRNRIKTANGVVSLTVPVEKMPREAKISEIKISYERSNPLERHWKTIELAYKKAPYFKIYKPFFEEVYSKRHVLLRDLNIEIIILICNILGIGPKIVFSSDLALKDDNLAKTEKVVNLCKNQGITQLYDAGGAEEILDKSLFEKENIEITFQNFQHPEYPQLWGEFAPYLSVIDLIFNQGDKSFSIIKSGIKDNKIYGKQ
ncbi:MAG: WbqC family protein [Candidatus Paceibacterota bacterium]